VNRGTAKAGDVAGNIRGDGYRQIGIDGRDYLAHVIIWVGVQVLGPNSRSITATPSAVSVLNIRAQLRQTPAANQ